jgi:hypothetical protein
MMHVHLHVITLSVKLCTPRSVICNIHSILYVEYLLNADKKDVSNETEFNSGVSH